MHYCYFAGQRRRISERMKNRSRKKNTNTLLPVILIGVGALMVIAVLAIQMLQPGQQTAPPAANNPGNIPEPSVERVSLADSKRAFDEQSAVFLDVRSAESYAAGHIPGAVNIPFDQLEARMSELDPNQWIITYCT